MFEWLPIIITVLTSIAAIITITLSLRNFLKRPHIHFKLQKGEFKLTNPKQEAKLSFLLASVINRKKSFFGETAKKVSTLVLFRAPSEDNWLGLNSSAGIPWLKTFGGKKKINERLNSEEAIKNALEKHVFDRQNRDIPQGMGEFIVVAYGIEKSNKLYLASIPPIEIPLPPRTKSSKKLGHTMTGTWFRLGIAGENISSTMSPGSMIFGESWIKWGFPTEVKKIATTSKLGNLKLRLGIGQKEKVLDVV